MEGIIAGKGFVVNGQKDVFFGYQVGAGDMYGSPFAALNGEGTMFLTSLDYHGGSDFFETWYTSYGIMSRSFLADNGWVEKDTLFRLPLHHEGTVTLATLEDIPPPQDVAAAVATHNTDGEAHADIRKAAADAIALATNFTGRVLEVGGVSATGGTVSVDNGAPDKYTHYDAGDPTTFRLANEDGAQMTTFRMYKDSRGVFHPYDNLAGIEWTQVSPSEVTLSLQGSTAVMMRLVMASDPGNPDLFTMSWQSSAGWTLTDNGVGVVSGAERVTLTPNGFNVTASGKASQLVFPDEGGTLATREWAGGEFAKKGDLDGKLDKVTTVSNLSRVYGVSSVGVQSMIGYNHNTIADTLVLRSGTQINTDLLPVNPSHATSKKYVDDAVRAQIAPTGGGFRYIDASTPIDGIQTAQSPVIISASALINQEVAGFSVQFTRGKVSEMLFVNVAYPSSIWQAMVTLRSRFAAGVDALYAYPLERFITDGHPENNPFPSYGSIVSDAVRLDYSMKDVAVSGGLNRGRSFIVEVSGWPDGFDFGSPYALFLFSETPYVISIVTTTPGFSISLR